MHFGQFQIAKVKKVHGLISTCSWVMHGQSHFSNNQEDQIKHPIDFKSCSVQESHCFTTRFQPIMFKLFETASSMSTKAPNWFAVLYLVQIWKSNYFSLSYHKYTIDLWMSSLTEVQEILFGTRPIVRVHSTITNTCTGDSGEPCHQLLYYLPIQTGLW